MLTTDREPECASLAEHALDPDGAVVGFDNALDPRQADAFADDVVHSSAPAAAENVESPADAPFFDADAGGANVKLRLVLANDAADANFPHRSLRSHVFDGVVDEILQHLPKARFFANQGRQRCILQKLNLFAAQVVLEDAAQIADDRFDVDQFDLLPPGFDARQLQQFGNQLRFGLDVLLNRLQPMNNAFAEFRLVLGQQQRCHSRDVSQWT